MYTLGYSFRPWTNAKAIADGAVDPRVRARDGRGVRHRSQDPLRAPRRARARGRATDARWTVDVREVAVRARPCASHVQLPLHVRRLLRLRRGLHAGVRRARALPRARRAPAEVDARHRLRGQARRRHRQRRDGGDARARAGEARRARHDAAALADVHRLRAGARRRSPTGCASASRASRPTRSRAGRTCSRAWRSTPTAGASRSARRSSSSGRSRSRSRGKVDVDAHFTPVVQARGISACASCPTAISSRPSARAARRSSPTTSRRSPRTASGSARARSSTADLVVTATGLKLKFLGGLALEVDGKRVEPSKTMAYKGMMCSDVPNLALAIGYTNASWTLKCDLTCEYVCRLLNYMDEHGYTQCCPRRTRPDGEGGAAPRLLVGLRAASRSTSFRGRGPSRRGGSTRTTRST